MSSEPLDVAPPVEVKTLVTHHSPQLDDPRRCSAIRSTDRQPCMRWAILGGTVCPTHGGSAGAVKQRAKLRLIQLIEPAVATLAREMQTADKSADRQRAANSLLDRAGMPRQQVVTAEDGRAQVIAALLERREALLNAEAEDSANPDIVEATLVPEPTTEEPQP